MIRKLLSFWPDGPVAAGVMLTLGSVLAFAPDLFLTMLARAFLWQWAIAFLVIAFWNVIDRRWWTVGAAGVSAALVIWPPLVSVQRDDGNNGQELLRVAQMNVLQPNDDHAEVLASALASGAHVISFQEVTPEWAAVLERGLRDTYPHHRSMPGNNCYGIAIFSRVPFEEAAITRLCGRPMVEAVVRTPHGPVRLLCVHATSPGSYAQFRQRNAQLDRLGRLINASSLPTVLIGDLNTVSWDRAMERLCERTGLREHPENTSATWPSVAGLALIPLDHVLVTGQLAVSSLRTFRISGSDHRGVVATIRART